MMESLSYIEVLELGSTMYGNCDWPPNIFAFGRNVGPSVQPRYVRCVTRGYGTQQREQHCVNGCPAVDVV